MPCQKEVDTPVVIRAHTQIEALEQQARDLARSVETVRQQTLAQSNERIEALEQKARDLAWFVETTRQQTLLQSDKKTEALEQKARDLANFVETLAQPNALAIRDGNRGVGATGPGFGSFRGDRAQRNTFAIRDGNRRVGQKARDLAVSVESVREETLLQSDTRNRRPGATGSRREETLGRTEIALGQQPDWPCVKRRSCNRIRKSKDSSRKRATWPFPWKNRASRPSSNRTR